MILVIDDTPAAADALAKALRDSGREALIASTVDVALVALASATPLCVVLDLVLDRDPSGLHDALAKRGIPVLLVSAVDPARLPIVAAAHGWKYLAKPFEPAALVDAVAQLVEHGTGRHSAVPSSIARSADGAVRATRSTAQILAEMMIGLGALALEAFIISKPEGRHPAVLIACIVGALLVVGVKVNDLLALSRALPSRGGGPVALLLATLTTAGALASRLWSPS